MRMRAPAVEQHDQNRPADAHEHARNQQQHRQHVVCRKRRFIARGCCVQQESTPGSEPRTNQNQQRTRKNCPPTAVIDLCGHAALPVNNP